MYSVGAATFEAPVALAMLNWLPDPPAAAATVTVITEEALA